MRPRANAGAVCAQAARLRPERPAALNVGWPVLVMQCGDELAKRAGQLVC